ncbi:hypothetical protein OPV22_021150 [Ensete ventricosum]|uniref:Uncharacterized protein n=1 Tax=Ensete ventricosum TaxID=4639 RepID=A0AAV8QKJ4_ENSVE|nr:hypothetical protein OPV22_021150 [Ensete ventricosum]
MISSLVAVSAQHYLLWLITLEHETLENLELIDMDGQRVLMADQRQLEEFRVKPVSASTGGSWISNAFEEHMGSEEINLRVPYGVGRDKLKR